jgi:hypothetical protein
MYDSGSIVTFNDPLHPNAKHMIIEWTLKLLEQAPTL